MTFGDFLYKKRLEEKLTVREFANILSIEAENVNVLENNQEKPSDFLINKIINTLLLNEEEIEIIYTLIKNIDKTHALKEKVINKIGEKKIISAIRIPIGLKLSNEEWKDVVNHFSQSIS